MDEGENLTIEIYDEIDTLVTSFNEKHTEELEKLP